MLAGASTSLEFSERSEFVLAEASTPEFGAADLSSLSCSKRRRLGPHSTATNANMSSRELRQCCKLDQAGELILRQAMTELGLSARAHDKVLRVSRTIADLEQAPNIAAHHLAEAVQYRRLDRKL